MTKYAPPPSLAEAFDELEMLSQIGDDGILLGLADAEALLAPPPEPETISVGELLLLNIETRIGRIAAACEASNKIKAAGTNNLEALTQQVHRLADALDAVSNTLAEVTERVEGKDGKYRGYIRHDRTTGHILSFRDDSDED
jgi:hypothetical protein